MGSNDVGTALETMVADPESADRMAAGDFSDLPEADLTEAERAMVTAAAGEIPEVDGFFMKLGDIKGEVRKDSGEAHLNLKMGDGFTSAARYAGWKVGG